MTTTLTLSKLRASVAIAAVASAAFTAHAQASERFIMAHAMPSDHIFHAISERFIEELQESEEFQIAYHPGGDLGDWTSLFEQSMQGVVPMSLTWGASEFDQRMLSPIGKMPGKFMARMIA